MKRRLAAILVADAAGYSRLMEADEEGAARRIVACRGVADAQIAEAEGRLFKTMGDAILAEFASPINALHCAVAIREGVTVIEKEHDPPITFRFGLHLADVMVDGDDLIGDGVNLAARIQQAAGPGEIWLSAAMFEQIRRTSPYAFDELGERRFRNIGEPVRVYRLRGEIRRHPYQITPTERSPSRPRRPYSLAVMPFELAPGEEEHRYLAEGIAEELIFELGHFRKLFVTSRTATRALQEAEADPKRIGDQLGVRYVLTGTLRRVGPRVRLALSLYETEAGTVVWNERFDLPLDELMHRLDEVVPRIAATVLGRVEASDIAAARQLRPESMTAYDCYLRGLEFHRLGGITDDNKREAMRWFRRAIEADPNFSRPWAMLTCAWTGLPDFRLAEGMANVEQALALDPNDPEANRIMGSIKLGAGEYEAARQYHEKAMMLSPSDAYIKARSANFYTFVGEPERALALLDEAEALDPFLPVWCAEERVVALYVLDRREEAVDAGRSLAIQTRRSRLYRAASHVALGNLDRARRIVAEALVSSPELTVAFIRQTELYRDPAVQRRLVDRLVKAGLPRAAVVARAS